MPERKLYCVIPAAGRSRRMGRPKLLLPLGKKTIIAHLLSAIEQAGVRQTFVVVRVDDIALREEVEGTGATCLQPPVPPAEMRISVQFALAEIERTYHPNKEDGWLLIPADHPVLDVPTLRQLMAAWNNSNASILLPSYGEKRGHPTFFRWSIAAEVPAIPIDCGLNWLLKKHAAEVEEISVNHSSVVTDLDTPEEYSRLVDSWSPPPTN